MGERDHEHDDHEHDHDHKGHTHAEDEECDCDDHEHDGHDHEHEHKLANGEVEVNLHEEGALIASGSLTLVGAEVEDISTRLSVALATVAGQVDAAGGLIGHLKATITNSSVRMLSTTAAETEVSVKLSANSEVLVNVVLIVFMVDQDDLLKWGQQLMAALQ